MEIFLKPFLEKNTVLSYCKVPIDINDSTDSSIIKYLQKIIFKHDVLLELKNILNWACSSGPFTVKNDTIKKIIQSLNTVLTSDEDVKTKADVFRYVFQSYVSSCKEDESLCIVQFFLVLSHILGIDRLNETRDCVIIAENFNAGFNVETPTLLSGSFPIFKEVLLCLSKTSVNLNAIEIQYYKWLLNVIKNIAHVKPFQNIFMEIFYAAAEVDLKLLEGNLDDIFCSIFALEKSINEEFLKLYPNFLEQSFKISAQFQRSVKFISKFLAGVKNTPKTLLKDILLPSNFIIEYSRIVSGASNQQSLSLLDVLIQNTDECFNFISQKESGSDSSLLYITSELFINFLKNVKLFAPSIALTTLQALIGKMNILKEILLKFESFLFSSKSFILKNENIVKIFLELCYFWGEIQMLINCYKDSILDPSEIKESASGGDWLSCVDPEHWKVLVKFVLKSKLVDCDSQCFQLAMQKLRSCKLENKSLMDDTTQKIILHQMTFNLSKFNMCQQLPPEDLIILMEMLTVKQSETVTKNIFRYLQENYSKTETASWLSNSAVQENPLFIAAIFAEIFKNTGTLLLEMINDKHSSKVTWLCGDYWSDSSDILDTLSENVNVILKNGKKLRKFITNRKSLARNLEVFKFLPLFCMKEEFRRLGLSFAVAMATLLSNDECAVCVAFESICNFLFSNLDPSTCFDIGLFMKFLCECSYENERTEFLKVKIIESLVRNCANMKLGLNQMEDMIDSADSFKLSSPMKVLESQVLIYNELGKCWQRGKKRKSDNDVIGSCRTKLAKIISDESKELPNAEISSENCEILLKILAIEINKVIRSKDENEMKNLIENKFPPYFNFAIKNLKKGFDDSSVMFLTIVLQSIPQFREFLPENSIVKIWKALKNQEKVNWRLFCINTTEEEFSEILADLMKTSQKFLYTNSDKYSYNCFEIWVSFFNFTSNSKNKACQLHIQEFFNYIYVCDSFLNDFPIRKKIYLMKFFLFCVTNKEVIVTSRVVDAIIRVILLFDYDSSSIEDFQSVFTAEVDVASAILGKQFAWSRSKIHLIFVMFQHLLKLLMKRCDTVGEITDKDDIFMLSSCSFAMEKWVNLMVKKEKDFARISPYFITALISSIASVTVLPAIKIHLTNCINHFLSMSDSHTVAYLMRILKPGYQQVFKTLYTQFEKYHKYTGKV